MKLAIIIGTTREGRQTPKQAAWVAGTVEEVEGIDAEIVDLADYDLPFFAEAISPRFNQNRVIDPAVKPWLDKLNEFDAYIFVTPEYNHSIPGTLKNALDYVTWELNRKPAAVVSHGTVGGARATMHLKEILSESKAAIIPNAIAMAGMSEQIDTTDGVLAEAVRANPYGPHTQLVALLSELQWYSDALAAARETREKVAA